MARILVADDEVSMRELIARALKQDGHDVMTAADGADALEVLTRERGAVELLLADIRMPVMDGIGLALAAARDYPDTTILLMTGYADQRERASGLDALIHDVLAKPFAVETLRAAVAGALATRAGARRSSHGPSSQGPIG
ncbi:MAG: response regulator [Hyphomicrobiales bacterium]|nr:response regulator [Hyphomicrobiales bacterium]